ncbi:MAG: preprotein translocase subunit SecG [Candidatus Omnitrophica bacterium]|nr:preprotein translocase subunit SecG [Candidatus Omnitrophota bacterium]
MTITLIIIHVLICFLLIVLILIQAGRGGGLVESFSSVESMFGPKTNSFLTRSTTILSILFFITCVSLALLSARQGRSLMRDVKPSKAAGTSIPVEATQTPVQEPQAQEQVQAAPQDAAVKQEATTPEK